MLDLGKKFTLRATQNAVKTVLLDVQSQYCERYSGISALEYVSDEPWSDGGIHFYGHKPGRPYLMHIGVNSFGMYGSTKNMVSDLDMTRMLVAIGHETGHMRDMQNYMSVPNDPTGMRLAAEIVAGHDNQAYYFKNYAVNETEIRAEYQGVFFAKNILTEAMETGTFEHASGKSVDACVESLLVDYVNYRRRVENGDYYIVPVDGSKFSSLSEIESAFDDAVDRSIRAKRVYPAPEVADTDVFPRMAGIAGQECCSNFDSLGEMFLSAKSPYEQNLMIAAVTSFGFPGKNQSISISGWFPALQDTLPLHPIDSDCGNPAVAAKREADYKTTVWSAFGDAAKRLCPDNPASLMPTVEPSILSCDYKDCVRDAAQAARVREKNSDSVYNHFLKAAVHVRSSVMGRNVGPEFAFLAKTSEEIRREYGDSW